jgi:hypothetical protein
VAFGTGPDAPARARRRRRRGRARWSLAIAVVLGLGLLAWCAGPPLLERLRGAATDETPTEATEAIAPRPEEAPLGSGAEATPEAPPVEQIEEDPPTAVAEAHAEPGPTLPPLAESDAWVREQIAPLSEHPALSRWLRHTGLVDLFVVAVDNVAEGVSPRKPLPFLRPEGSYLVLGAGDALRTDPASYLRYKTAADVVASLDAGACAPLYRLLLPLFQESYVALGYPDRSFDDRFAEALRHLLATPVPPREPALEERVGRYVYADDDLESLTDAQKQLLRLGPRSVRTVQETLREIAAALGIEV